jgi:hypothetical protein
MALPRRAAVGVAFLGSVMFSELVRIKIAVPPRVGRGGSGYRVADEGGPASVFGLVGNPGVVTILIIVHLLHEESVYFGLAR